MTQSNCLSSGGIKSFLNSISGELLQIIKSPGDVDTIQANIVAHIRQALEINAQLIHIDDLAVEATLHISRLAAANLRKSPFSNKDLFKECWRHNTLTEPQEAPQVQTEEVLFEPVQSVSTAVYNNRFLYSAYQSFDNAREHALAAATYEFGQAVLMNRGLFTNFENLKDATVIDAQNRHTFLRAYQKILYDRIVDAFFDGDSENIDVSPTYTKDVVLYNEKGQYLDVFDRLKVDYGTKIETYAKNNLANWYINRDTDPRSQRKLDGYRAYVTLGNFDSFLSIIFGKDLKITPGLIGVQQGKYVYNSTMSKQTAINTLEEHNAIQETSQSIKAVIQGCKYYNYGDKAPRNGRFLDYGSFASTIAWIKEIVYDSQFTQSIKLTNFIGEFTDEFRNFCKYLESPENSTTDDISETMEYIKFLQDKLQKNEITLYDAINSMRLNPMMALGPIINLTASPYLWDTKFPSILAGDSKLLKSVTTPLKNTLWTIQKEITSKSNEYSVHSIMLKYMLNDKAHVFNNDDFYQWIAENCDSLFESKFLQYYQTEDKTIEIRELYDQQVTDMKNRINFSINSINMIKNHEALEIMKNEFPVDFDLENRTVTIEVKNINQDPIKLYVDANGTVFVQDGVVYKNIEDYLQNVNLEDKDALIKFINRLTGLRFIEGSDYYNNFMTLSSGDLLNKEVHGLGRLLTLSGRLYRNRVLGDAALDLANTVAKYNRKSLELYAKSGLWQIGDKNPKIDNVLQDLNLIYAKDDLATLFDLAEAKVIAIGMSMSSQVKNGEGNALGKIGFSRLVNSLPTQITTQCLLPTSATRDMCLINTPNLYQGIYKMEEAKIGATVKNHTEFNVAEFGSASFFLDFVGGLAENPVTRAAVGNGKIALLASVNSDKKFIPRMMLNLNTDVTINGVKYNLLDLATKKIEGTSELVNKLIADDLGAVYNRVSDLINSDLQLLQIFASSYDSNACAVMRGFMTENGNQMMQYSSYEAFNKYCAKIGVKPTTILKRVCLEYNQNFTSNPKRIIDYYRSIKATLPSDLQDSVVLSDAEYSSLSPDDIVDFLDRVDYRRNIALYDNLHLKDSADDLLTNGTLLDLQARFTTDPATGEYSKLNQFWNIKNFEMVRSAISNNFEYYVKTPQIKNTGELQVETQELAQASRVNKFLKENLGNDWIAEDSHFIFSKVTFKVAGKEGRTPQLVTFNITNEASLYELQNFLTEHGVDSSQVNVIKDFTSLRTATLPEGVTFTSLEINPLMEMWNKFDYLFTQEFMLASVGSHISHPVKATSEMAKLEGEEFILAQESSRFFALHKRNVSMTASKREFLLNSLRSPTSTYKVAVIKDVKDILGNYNGLVDKAKPYDGATFNSPLTVLLENYALGAEHAGLNKKQFGHFYQEAYACAGIIKTAGFGITNGTMRDSLMDRTMAQHMMSLKWTRQIPARNTRYNDGWLFENHIYNLLVDYDGERINYNNGTPLYYSQQVTYKIPEELSGKKLRIVHRSLRTPYMTEVTNIKRVNATEGYDNMLDLILVIDNQNGKTYNAGDLITETFYWARQFDADHALFIESDGEFNGIQVKRGLYVFKDTLMDVTIKDGTIFRNGAKSTGNTPSITNTFITPVVDSNYAAYTELFMGYRGIENTHVDGEEYENQLLKAFEYSPLEEIEHRTGSSTFEHTEKSIAYLAEAACLVGDKLNGQDSIVKTQSDVWQPMKHSEINYAITEGAIKQMPANINNNNAYYDSNALWNWFEILANELGIQLDKEHHADTEEVSLMNQVVSAISARGFSLYQDRQAYKAIEALTTATLSSLANDFEGFLQENIDPNAGTQQTRKFINAVKRLLLHELENASVRDGEFLNNIATKIYEQLQQGGDILDTPVKLAGSDPLLYNKLSSLLSTTITKVGIKIKLSGILDVLCPSHDRMMVYNGKLLGHLNIVDLIKANKNAHRPENNWVNKINLITLNTTFDVYNSDGQLIEKWTPKTPLDIYNMQERIATGNITGVYENILVGRNLGHYNAQFTILNEDGSEYVCSLMDLDSIKYKALLEKLIEDKEKADKKAASSFKQALQLESNALIYNTEDNWDAANKAKSKAAEARIAAENINERIANLLNDAARTIIPDLLKISNLNDLIKLAQTLLNREIQGDLCALSPNYDSAYTSDEINKVRIFIQALVDNGYLGELGKNILAAYLGNMQNRTFTLTNALKQYLISNGIINNGTERLDFNDFAKTKLGLVDFALLKHTFVTKNWSTLDIANPMSCASLYKEMQRLGSDFVTVNGKLVIIDKNKVLVKPYEVVMSKTLKSKLGLKTNDCVQDLVKDPLIFTKRLVDAFQSKISLIYFDVQFKRADGDHISVVAESNVGNLYNWEEITPLTIKDDEFTYRVDNLGNRLYKFHEGDRIYRDQNGNDLIVSTNLGFYVDNLSYQTLVASEKFAESWQYKLGDSTHNLLVDLLSSANNCAKNWMHDIGHLKGERLKEANADLLYLNAFKYFMQTNSKKDSFTIRHILNLGLLMHASFLQTLELIAARIPAQSMLSFMPMIIADFVDADINTAYVSTSQIWLQGSDYDIDAVSLASYTLDNSGRFVGWSPFFKMRTQDLLKWSCQLPFPTGKNIVYKSSSADKLEFWNGEKLNDNLRKEASNAIKKDKARFTQFIIPILQKISLNDANSFATYMEDEATNQYSVNLNLDSKEQYKEFSEFIDYLNDFGAYDLAEMNKEGGIEYGSINSSYIHLFNLLVEKVNLHNNYINKVNTETAIDMSKNMLVHSMHSVSNDPINLIESLMPVDYVTGPYKELANSAPGYKELVTYTPGNVWNKIQAIIVNLVGKDGISRCAIGMKGFFAATYAANYILEHGTAEQQRRLLASKALKATWQKAGISVSGVIANLRTKSWESIQHEDVLAAMLMVDNDTDAALVLSALMSLATDNAKELCLGNLNAGTKLIPLYIYGITQGIPFHELFKILTSDLGWTCTKLFNSNFVTEENGMYDLDSVFNYLLMGPSLLIYSVSSQVYAHDSAYPVTVTDRFQDLFFDALKNYISKNTQFINNNTIEFNSKKDLLNLFGEGFAESIQFGTQGNRLTSTSLISFMAKFANTGILLVDKYTNKIRNNDEWKDLLNHNKFTIQDKLNILNEVKLLALKDDNLNSDLIKLIDKLSRYVILVGTIYTENGIETIAYNGIHANEKGYNKTLTEKYGPRRAHTTLDLLLSLAAGAKDITTLGQILSINNGIKSTIYDKWKFIKNFEELTALERNSKYNIAYRAWFEGTKMNKDNAPTGKVDIARLSTDPEYAEKNGKIDLGKFVTDSRYAEEKARDYDGVKQSSYNILDILHTCENFRGFIKAAALDNGAANAISAKFRSYSTLLSQAIKLSGATSSKDIKAIATGVENLVGDVLFRKWLSQTGIKVVVPSGHKYIDRGGTIQTNNQDNDMLLDLSTHEGLATFKFRMDQEVLPSIINGESTYMYNPGWSNELFKTRFVLLLTPTITDRNPIRQTVNAYSLDINMSPLEPAERSILNDIRAEFNQLTGDRNRINRIINFTGEFQNGLVTIPFQLLMWLYNQVAFFGKAGEQTLTSIFDNFNVEDPMSISYRTFMLDFDQGTKDTKSDDIMLGRDISTAELSLWTAGVINLWSSNLNYGFNKSTSSLTTTFVERTQKGYYDVEQLDQMELDAELGNKMGMYDNLRFSPNTLIIPNINVSSYMLRGIMPNDVRSVVTHDFYLGTIPLTMQLFTKGDKVTYIDVGIKVPGLKFGLGTVANNITNNIAELKSTENYITKLQNIYNILPLEVKSEFPEMRGAFDTDWAYVFTQISEKIDNVMSKYLLELGNTVKGDPKEIAIKGIINYLTIMKNTVIDGLKPSVDIDAKAFIENNKQSPEELLMKKILVSMYAPIADEQYGVRLVNINNIRDNVKEIMSLPENMQILKQWVNDPASILLKTLFNWIDTAFEKYPDISEFSRKLYESYISRFMENTIKNYIDLLHMANINIDISKMDANNTDDQETVHRALINIYKTLNEVAKEYVKDPSNHIKTLRMKKTSTTVVLEADINSTKEEIISKFQNKLNCG